MSDADVYDGMLLELVESLWENLQDDDLYHSDPFNEGYRAGVRMAAQEISDAIRDISILTGRKLPMFDVDEWYREGKLYRWKGS